MAQAGPVSFQPPTPDQSTRREALDQAVRFALRPEVTATTDGIVNTAEKFYKFLAGPSDLEAK